MYVRTWKDTDMVATSDSSQPGSTAGDEQDPTPPADPESTTASDVAESPTEEPAAPPTEEPAAPPVASPRPAESPKDPPVRTRARRARPGVSRDQVKGAVNGLRERIAAVVWILTVIAAVILAAGALLIALDANPKNDLVQNVVDWAGGLDGPFSDMFTFDGDNQATKEALVNWGLAAVAWLVGGKIASAIIRP